MLLYYMYLVSDRLYSKIFHFIIPIWSNPQDVKNLWNFSFQANRDAGIREAECEKAAMDVKYNTDTKIEDNSRAFKLQKANFDKEVNTAVSINIS